jgi:hypothetical protein
MVKPRYIITFFALALWIAPACNCHRPRSQPSRPAGRFGWKTEAPDENGSVRIGEFVLKEGESIHNGEFVLTVQNITAPDLCAEAYSASGSPSVVFEFSRMSDKQKLCTSLSLDGGRGTLGDCGDKLAGASFMAVHEINTQDNWVHFELYK